MPVNNPKVIHSDDHDLSKAVLRATWVEKSRGGTITLDQTFLDNTPDTWIDSLIETKKKYAPLMAEWPKEAELMLSVSGDRGSYCEDDNRSFQFNLSWPVGDTTRSFQTTCSFNQGSFLATLTKNIERLSELASFS